MFVRRKRLTAWIAIFAVLLAALAPVISQAFAALQPQPAPWAEICSAAGLQVRPGLASHSESGDHEGKMSAHCPFCLNHAGHFALPARPPVFVLPRATGTPSPSCSRVGNSPRFTCISPPLRAPPAFS